MRTIPFLTLALALAACVVPEGGIDRTVLRGTVRVEPVLGQEQMDIHNHEVASATQVEAPEFAHKVISGVIKSWGYNAETGTMLMAADKDWYAVKGTFDGTLGLTVILDGLAENSQVWLELVDLTVQDEETGVYAPLSFVMAGAGQHDLSFEVVKGGLYGLRVGGAVGEGEFPYRLILAGQDPSLAEVKVGAYRPPESGDFSAVNRGNPVGGASVGAFSLAEDLSWTASWEMNLLRAVQTTPAAEEGGNPTTTVDEALTEVVLLAGDFSKLEGMLKAGTWYSSGALAVDLTAAPLVDEETGVSYILAETPLALDAFAPLVIGVEVAEVEPNDVPVDGTNYTIDVADPSLAQDLGALSGPGFVDILRGSSPILTADSGWVHDVDAFHFTVPATQEIFFSLDWSDAAMDQDFVVVDGAGEWLEHGATSAKPEVNYWGGAIFEPETDYFLVVMGYVGTEGTDPTWELSMEQVGQ